MKCLTGLLFFGSLFVPSIIAVPVDEQPAGLNSYLDSLTNSVDLSADDIPHTYLVDSYSDESLDIISAFHQRTLGIKEKLLASDEIFLPTLRSRNYDYYNVPSTYIYLSEYTETLTDEKMKIELIQEAGNMVFEMFNEFSFFPKDFYYCVLVDSITLEMKYVYGINCIVFGTGRQIPKTTKNTFLELYALSLGEDSPTEEYKNEYPGHGPNPAYYIRDKDKLPMAKLDLLQISNSNVDVLKDFFEQEPLSIGQYDFLGYFENEEDLIEYGIDFPFSIACPRLRNSDIVYKIRNRFQNRGLKAEDMIKVNSLLRNDSQIATPIAIANSFTYFSVSGNELNVLEWSRRDPDAVGTFIEYISSFERINANDKYTIFAKLIKYLATLKNQGLDLLVSDVLSIDDKLVIPNFIYAEENETCHRLIQVYMSIKANIFRLGALAKVQEAYFRFSDLEKALLNSLKTRNYTLAYHILSNSPSIIKTPYVRRFPQIGFVSKDFENAANIKISLNLFYSNDDMMQNIAQVNAILESLRVGFGRSVGTLYATSSTQLSYDDSKNLSGILDRFTNLGWYTYLKKWNEDYKLILVKDSLDNSQNLKDFDCEIDNMMSAETVNKACFEKGLIEHTIGDSKLIEFIMKNFLNSAEYSGIISHLINYVVKNKNSFDNLKKLTKSNHPFIEALDYIILQLNQIDINELKTAPYNTVYGNILALVHIQDEYLLIDAMKTIIEQNPFNVSPEVVKHLLEKGAIRNDECSICYDLLDDSKDSFSEDDRVIVHTCKQGFHKKCLSTWSAINDSCPMCRRRLGNFDIYKVKLN